MTVFQTIRELRRAAGFSQRELAERVGISKVQVNRIESGKFSKLETLNRILAVFDREAVIVVQPKTSGLDNRA